MKSGSESRSVVSNSLRPRGLYSQWSSPGQNTRVGSLSLLKGIFPTQGLNPGSPHCKQIHYQLNHKNTGLGSLSPLQWIIPTQELTWVLLPCRQILYQLRYQGSPCYLVQFSTTKTKFLALKVHYWKMQGFGVSWPVFKSRLCYFSNCGSWAMSSHWLESRWS